MSRISEEWKPIKGYGKDYHISNLGRVKSFKRKRVKNGIIKRLVKDSGGYLNTSFCKGGMGTRIRVHLLVAMHFIKKPHAQSPLEINHKNGKKNDNRVENLEWVTRSENILHALKNGLRIPAHGNKIHTCKLDENKVKEIRKLEGKSSSRAVAKIYNISKTNVNDIWNNAIWKHV